MSGQGTGATVLGHTFASLDDHCAAELFLAHESELFDSRRYAEWGERVEESFTYQVPVPRTPDNPFSPHYDDRVMFIDESKWSLTQQWFRRLDADVYELSWAENPPVRFRHFVSNVRVRLTDDPDVLDVRSNVLLAGVRQSDLPKFITAERFDTLVRHGEQLKMRRRWAVLDETLLDFPQLRIML